MAWAAHCPKEINHTSLLHLTMCITYRATLLQNWSDRKNDCQHEATYNNNTGVRSKVAWAWKDFSKDRISAQNDGRELSMPPKQRNPGIWFIWTVFQNIWNIFEIFEKLLQILKTYCLQKNFNFQLTLITKYIVFYSFDL